jgi:hypothetical protein
MKGASQKSLFANCLVLLLDETHFFTRKEWARYLGVTTKGIEDWVRDRGFPRGDLLRKLMDVLKCSPDVPNGPLEMFDGLVNRPLAEITPLADLLESATLAEYLADADAVWIGLYLKHCTSKQAQFVLCEGTLVR